MEKRLYVGFIITCVGAPALFFLGYFWGRRALVEQLSDQFQQEIFADKIYTSIAMLYEGEQAELDERISHD